MASMTKKQKVWQDKVEAGKDYAPLDAFTIIKELATAKFDESIDLCINMGVDSRKSDQNVRGSVVLPHGTGKTVRVAVFADGEQATAAKEAGADIVGMDELADEVKKGNMNFDVVIASPDSMRVVGQLGQILGPRGLMPNPKVGTVTPDVANAVKNAKAGQVQFRTDKGGLIHGTIGRASFSEEALLENMQVFVEQLNKLKPSSAKGIYLKKITVSSTMGPGVLIEKSAVAGK